MGGCASKQTDDERYMGTATSDTSPFSSLFDLHKAVCKVGVEQSWGFGFLCKFPLENDPENFVYGLLTNNYTLGSNELQSGQVTLSFVTNVAGEKRSFETRMDPQTRFRFTCPVFDATFIHITEAEVDQLKKHKRLFLTLSTDWEGARGEEVLVIQQQSGNKTRFANGTFLRYNGFDILHTSSSDVGSWGSPLALRDGKVIGLHKRKAPQNTSQYDVALSSKVLVEALRMHCYSARPEVKLVSNPVRFNPDSELRIVEHGLAKCASIDKKSLIFVSPMEEDDKDKEEIEADDKGFARPKPPKLDASSRAYTITGGLEEETQKVSVDTSIYVSPLWYTPTSHGWYWTPTDPFDRSKETNWMSTTTRYVVGGAQQHGKKMLKKDVEVGRWLRSTGGIQKN